MRVHLAIHRSPASVGCYEVKAKWCEPRCGDASAETTSKPPPLGGWVEGRQSSCGLIDSETFKSDHAVVANGLAYVRSVLGIRLLSVGGQRGGEMDHNQLGIGRRVLAVVINIVVVVALLVVLGLLFHKTHSGNGSASVNLTGASALIWLVLALAYLIVPKVFTGQTFGRRLVGGQSRR
jgi:hypothetical protein